MIAWNLPAKSEMSSASGIWRTPDVFLRNPGKKLWKNLLPRVILYRRSASHRKGVLTLDHDMRLAVLIDADNAPRNALREMMAEVAVYGNPTVKRIYGDWTSPNMNSWKPLLLEHAITPFQQYSYTTGKNATDSAMIIDAMDVLYTGNVDGFVLVSSDSDFTRLATRLREAGMKVFGMGEKKTPKPFIVACDKFVYIESLKAAETIVESPTEKHSSSKKKSAPAAEPKQLGVKELIAQSVEDLADEDGFAYLGDLGNLLMKKQPDFDPRNYGFSKLSKFIASLGCFEIDERHNANYQGTMVFLRNKRS